MDTSCTGPSSPGSSNDVDGKADVRLPYGERAAEWLAAERVRLEKAGKHMAVVDGQLAVVAATNGVPVITANVAEFASFKGGLSVRNWISQPAESI